LLFLLLDHSRETGSFVSAVAGHLQLQANNDFLQTQQWNKLHEGTQVMQAKVGCSWKNAYTF